MTQFETLRFLADAKGQARKNATLTYLSDRGWHVTGESIEQGKFKGSDACCLALICLPLGFAAGHDTNVAVVSIQRAAPSELPTFVHAPIWLIFDDNREICNTCELIIENGDYRRHRPYEQNL